MGKTLSTHDLGNVLGAHLRDLFAPALILFCLSLPLQSCRTIEDAPRPSADAKNGGLRNPVLADTKDMIAIPAGPFFMGTDEVDEKNEGLQLGFPQAWFEDEGPLHRVDLKAFYIDRTEVTEGDFLKFVRAAGHRQPPHWRHGAYKVGTEKHPVTFVDWYDANDYCRWRGKRLPTEGEWEKAARGPEGLRYPWGKAFDIGRAYLSPASDVLNKTAPVGRYPQGASPYGVLDMVGNVWEWTDSWYLPYPGSNLRKPAFGMKHRVVRGLSFHSLGHYPGNAYGRVLEVYARASTRSYDPPAERLGDLGFRCAKDGGQP